MNYRHAFHAGNFADVLKHVVLVALIEAQQRKPAPFCYVETHAGRGRYDLGSAQALRSREYADGVQRVFDAAEGPHALQRYVELVRGVNPGTAGKLVVYPGSPLLASLLMRDHDRAVLCELQDQEAAALRALFRNDQRIAVHRRDGYAALNALLPPNPRRGLVLIDPAFEAQETEFERIDAALDCALKRWPSGVYAIWYPIKLRRTLASFHRRLAQRGHRTEVLLAELMVRPATSALRLNGAGVAIINPPWQLAHEIARLLPALLRMLDQGGGTHSVTHPGSS
ncbi:MAG: 23S rRNA (adenine(2030)-N(6))-methyltransferase RlmJ [Rhodanobacteraceae bacterium]